MVKTMGSAPAHRRGVWCGCFHSAVRMCCSFGRDRWLLDTAMMHRALNVLVGWCQAHWCLLFSQV